jgi:hypothetical protein
LDPPLADTDEAQSKNDGKQFQRFLFGAERDRSLVAARPK